MLRPGKDEVKDTAAPTESSQTVESMPETEPETEPETQPEAERYVVTGNSVNVRTEPSTSSRILVQLSQGTEVDYVKRYNNDWTVINYDGQELMFPASTLRKRLRRVSLLPKRMQKAPVEQTQQKFRLSSRKFPDI